MVEWQISLINGCKMYQLKYAISLLRPSPKNVDQKSFLAKIRFKYHEQPVVKFELKPLSSVTLSYKPAQMEAYREQSLNF